MLDPSCISKEALSPAATEGSTTFSNEHGKWSGPSPLAFLMQLQESTHDQHLKLFPRLLSGQAK